MSRLAMTYGRREWIIELLLLLAEGALVWMVAALVFSPFAAHPDPVDPMLALGLVIVAGVLPRALFDRGIWGRSYSLVVATAVVVSTVVAVKAIAFSAYPWDDTSWLREAARSSVLEDSTADIVVWGPIGLVIGIWWLARFHGPPSLERCRATLRTGTAVAALVAIASTVVEPRLDDGPISLAIVCFYATTLVALAIARQGGEATRSLRQLLTTVVLPSAAIVAIASLFAAVVSFDSARDAPGWLSPLGVVLDPVFQILLLVLTGIVIFVSLPVLWLLSFGNFDPPPIQQTGEGGQAKATSALEWNPPDPVRYILATLFLVVILYLIARFVLILTRRDFFRVETGERDFGSSRGFGSWLDRFRWPFGRGSLDPLAALRNDPAWANTVRVRERYAAWLRWAQERRLGRAAAETPTELDRRTGPLLHSPTASAALDELTAIYDDVRYSAVPATGEQADRAARAWNQLKHDASTHVKS